MTSPQYSPVLSTHDFESDSDREQARERRRYFRIEDEVALEVKAIDAARLDTYLEDFWANEHEFSIRNNYNFQIEQHIADRHKIGSKMPELERYLGVLEKQIDRLTDKLIGDLDDQSMSLKTVNISAQGIAFSNQWAPQSEELVEIKMKLLPSGIRLVIIARVVQVEKDIEQNQHILSLDFEHLHEADRELLIKHMHNKQMESLSNEQEN